MYNGFLLRQTPLGSLNGGNLLRVMRIVKDYSIWMDLKGAI